MLVDSAAKKIVLLVIGLTALATLILFFIIIPTIRNIKQIADDTYDLRVFLEKQNERALAAKVTQKRAAKVKEAVANYPKYIFKKGDELKLITGFETIAVKNGVSQLINSTNLDKISDNKATISLSITGKYDKVLKYLVDIEMMDNYVIIESMQLSPLYGRTGEMSTEVTMTLFLSLYVAS